MRSILILLFSIVTLFAHAADNVTVFSNTGYRFWVIINGEKINKDATERVVFSKKAGNYKLRIIIQQKDGESSIDDKSDYPVEVKENYNHLFEVTVGGLFGSEFPKPTDLRTVILKKYSLVNTTTFNGKWTMKINNTKMEKLTISVLETGELSQTAPVVISDKDGTALMDGYLDRNTNAIHINSCTIALYAHVKKYFLEDARTAHCDWFYFNGFTPVLYISQNETYVSQSQLFNYLTTFNNTVECGENNVPKYDKKYIKLNLTLER